MNKETAETISLTQRKSLVAIVLRKIPRKRQHSYVLHRKSKRKSSKHLIKKSRMKIFRESLIITLKLEEIVQPICTFSEYFDFLPYFFFHGHNLIS